MFELVVLVLAHEILPAIQLEIRRGTRREIRHENRERAQGMELGTDRETEDGTG